jgi:hypothetical protein
MRRRFQLWVQESGRTSRGENKKAHSRPLEQALISAYREQKFDLIDFSGCMRIKFTRWFLTKGKSKSGDRGSPKNCA